jgi:hypothetical protein
MLGDSYTNDSGRLSFAGHYCDFRATWNLRSPEAPAYSLHACPIAFPRCYSLRCGTVVEGRHGEAVRRSRNMRYLLFHLPRCQDSPTQMQDLQEQVPRCLSPQMVYHVPQEQLSSLPDALDGLKP